MMFDAKFVPQVSWRQHNALTRLLVGKTWVVDGDVATLSLHHCQAWINKAQTAVELGNNHGRLINPGS
jgi:hypothetical protein